MDERTGTKQIPEIGRRILLCLDRHPSSEVALPHAVSLAKTFGGSITLLHVLRSPRRSAGPPASDALAWELSRQEALSYLQKIGSELTQTLGRPVALRLEQGRPAERIVDLARELGADITVLGSGAGGVILGSTAQQVLAASRSTILVAHSSMARPAAVKPRRILVPLDGSVRAESVLPAATRIAQASGATLLLAHIVQEPVATAVLDAADAMELARQLATWLQAGARLYLDQLRQRLSQDGASVEVFVARHVNDRKCLLEIAQNQQADLIVVSAHGAACDSAQSSGGVTAYLVGHTTLPVLVVQDLPEAPSQHLEEVDTTMQPPSSLRASYASGIA
jgi:nucleotide-binding universal stress UspA family protein